MDKAEGGFHFKRKDGGHLVASLDMLEVEVFDRWAMRLTLPDFPVWAAKKGVSYDADEGFPNPGQPATASQPACQARGQTAESRKQSRAAGGRQQGGGSRGGGVSRGNRG